MHEQADRWMDKRTCAHANTHARTHREKRHGRAVAHFIRVRMRHSVGQPSLLHRS